MIATGSRPAVPPIPGLDAVPYLTNETLFGLRENVPHLVVIGAGPIGCEMAQAFRRLGSEVTVVDAGPGLLPREDRDLAEVVQRALVDEGVRLRFGVSVQRAEGTRGDVRLVLAAKDGSVDVVGGDAPAGRGRTAGQRRASRAWTSRASTCATAGSSTRTSSPPTRASW